MAYEMKPNTGSLFPNDRKDTSQHPDKRGSALIGGVEYWVSAWTKSTKAGAPWDSLSFQPKNKQAAPSSGETVAPPMAARDDAFDDALPF